VSGIELSEHLLGEIKALREEMAQLRREVHKANEKLAVLADDHERLKELEDKVSGVIHEANSTQAKVNVVWAGVTVAGSALVTWLMAKFGVKAEGN
jgi:predicted nuclease with TOPRIM domain